MKTYRIAAIPGDGIGTEVVSAGVEVLHALAKREGNFQFKVDHFDWGGEYYKKNGRMMPENGRSLIRNHDAILFGSAGHPRHSRPHHPVGAAARDLPTFRPVRQRPPGAAASRHHESAAQCETKGTGLGDRPRELGGRVRGGRWASASGVAVGSSN